MKLKRIFILGTIGSGKTTLAKKISKILDIPNYYLDDFYWTTKYIRKRNRKVLEKKINNLVKNKSWIIEGVFSSWVSPIAKKADLVIWLDVSPFFASKNILKRYIKNKIIGKEKERGNFAEIWKTLIHARKYRTGNHKNSYKGHKKLIGKQKANFVILRNNKQIKEFIGGLK